MRRLPRPAEVGRLPGTGNAGGGVYTYTTAVEMTDRRTGARRTFTVVIQDEAILRGDVVLGLVQTAIQNQDITQRMGSGAPDLRRAIIGDMTILSVYRGNVEL